MLAAASLTAQACSDTSARTPAAVLGKAGSDVVGRRIEAQRMSSAVIGPWEVDPDLNRKDMPYAVMKSEALRDVFSQEAVRIAIDHGYVTGFANARSTNDSELPHDRRLKNFVMRFPDADAAAAAAPLLAAADRFGPGPVSPISIPDHPDTHAAAGVNDKGKHVVAAFTPRSRFVLHEWEGSVTASRRNARRAASRNRPVHTHRCRGVDEPAARSIGIGSAHHPAESNPLLLLHPGLWFVIAWASRAARTYRWWAGLPQVQIRMPRLQ